MGIRYRQPQNGANINWANPITRGLVCVDAVSAARDVITNKLDTIVGTKLVNDVTGQLRGFGSVLGAGTTDSVETALKTRATYRTFFVRALRNGAGGGNFGRIFEKRVSGSQAEAFYVANDGGQAQIRFAQFGVTERYKWYSWPPAGVAWPFVVTVDNTNSLSSGINLYIDGVLKTEVASQNGASPTTNTDAYVLGNRKSDSARYWDGAISDFFVWDRILSEEEILSLSRNPWQIFKPADGVILLKGLAGGPAQYTLTAQGGSYTKTGASATLLKSKLITAQGGSYAKSGASATLKYNRLISAQGGSYAKSGADAVLLRHKNLSVQGGSYTKTGANATITYTGLANSYTLTCQGGVYTQTGSTATILKSKLLVAAGGTYTFTGRPVVITYSGAPPTSGLLPYLNVLNGEFCLFKPLN